MHIYRRYLQQKQNCPRNSQQKQLPQQQPYQQHSLSYNKCHKHYGNYRQQLVTAISIILVNIIAEHNVNAITQSVAGTTASQMPTATVAISNVYIGSTSNTTPIIEISRDKIRINSNNETDVVGEIVDRSYLATDDAGNEGSGAQRQQQFRNGFRTKLSALDKEVVDRLIKEWAPIVWLAPEEKFMPLGVEEFLNHVHPMDKGKTFIPGMPLGDDSKKAYLVTNAEIDELLENERSFIYGRNPTEAPVPIYAVVKLCNDPMKNHSTIPTPTAPSTPTTSAPSSQTGTAMYTSNISPSANMNYEDSPQPHVTAAPTIPISNTRNAYIPISIDPLDMHNDTIRRSSRLYPVFKRLRRHTPQLGSSIPALKAPILLNLPPKGLVVQQYVDTILGGESPPQDLDKLNRGTELSTTDAQIIPTANAENSGQMNNFIANLVDNVKFSMPTGDERLDHSNNDIDSNFHRMPTHTLGAKFKNVMRKNSSEKKLKKVPSFHVTYWMFYPYSQGKTMCTLSLGPLGSIPFPAVYGFCLGRRKDIGSHIGDWEHMSLYFNGAAEPEAMYVSAHDAGAYYAYNRLTGSFEFKKQETRKGILQRPNFPKTVTTFNNHPVLFAAKGSHGLWTAPGKHRFVKVARLYDINGFGTPWNTWKSVDISYENFKSYGRSLAPSWLSFKGKWGNPKSKCHPFRRIGLNFCEYTDGPTGIPLKEPHFQCNRASYNI